MKIFRAIAVQAHTARLERGPRPAQVGEGAAGPNFAERLMRTRRAVSCAARSSSTNGMRDEDAPYLPRDVRQIENERTADARLELPKEAIAVKTIASQ